MSVEDPSIDKLESENRRINEEIRNYPTPIAGCDVQFNSLLEEQAKIVQELDRLQGSGSK
ncbi:MAG TPA: hypothetical protein VL572_09635 [Pyrinomonadaceae bacterium]|nr:hypothetical protein [Pyrinomonadaceae bacterium]